VVANTIVRCHRPEMRNVRIVAECEDAGIRNIAPEELLGPEDTRTLMRPSILTVSSDPMNEYDTVVHQ